MAIRLVRHAHAGSRSAWKHDDSQRPLSKRGRRQAEHLVDELGASRPDAGIGRILSSPAVRCIETVQPLAAALGLPIEESGLLFEGGDADAVIDLMLDLAPEGPVLCSHGDVIPAVLRRLRAAGLRSSDDHLCAKGSAWILEVEGRKIVAGRYVPPGT